MSSLYLCRALAAEPSGSTGHTSCFEDYKIESTNSTVETFKTAKLAGDSSPFAVALVIDMGVFGPDGLSSRNISYTGKAITSSLSPGAHTTIETLVADQDNYEFVLHPGDFAYAGS